jgi:hypothetical protein
VTHVWTVCCSSFKPTTIMTCLKSITSGQHILEGCRSGTLCNMVWIWQPLPWTYRVSKSHLPRSWSLKTSGTPDQTILILRVGFSLLSPLPLMLLLSRSPFTPPPPGYQICSILKICLDPFFVLGKGLQNYSIHRLFFVCWWIPPAENQHCISASTRD